MCANQSFRITHFGRALCDGNTSTCDRAQYASVSIDSNVEKIFLFKSKFSITASMTISTFAKSLSSRVPRTRPTIAFAFSGFILPFFTIDPMFRFDALDTGLKKFRFDLFQHHLHAAQKTRGGDATPHQTTANHADAFSLHSAVTFDP